MNAMVALDRARRAWERTSPQLVIDGWLDMLDRLDETQHGVECRPLRLVEPARSHRTPPRAGSPLAPNHAANQDEGLTAHRGPFAADTGRLSRRKGIALCGARGWYEREPTDDETTCPRCLDIARRYGFEAR